jgi:soluble lytic murein transglycosylase-like protein
MDALKAAGLCALLAAPPQAAQPCGQVVVISSSKIDRWQSLIEAASARFGIPTDWIRAVMARESAGLTALHGAPVVSSAGAMGLMQLMPDTWSNLRARYGLGNDPFDPRDNIFAGTAYLREMYDRYGYPNLFAAYHAGPGRMNAVLAGRKPLPETTKTYLESIVSDAEIAPLTNENRVLVTSKSRSDSLFFVRKNDETPPLNATERPRKAQGLFVPLASPPDTATR